MSWFAALLDARVVDYLFLAGSIALFLFLFVSARIEGVRRERRLQSALDECVKQISELKKGLQELGSNVADITDLKPEAGPVPGGPEWKGVNLTKRSQTLRMHRSGNPTDTIARALGVASGEVNLIIKVHKMLSEGAAASEKG
jgi:hypothetical protein